MRSVALWLAAAVGLGLAAAPAAFGMFERAPAGGEMLDDFRPFMRTEVLDDFADHLQRADAAATEADTRLVEVASTHLDVETRPTAVDHPAIQDLTDRWPAASDELGEMLGTIVANAERFHAVDALPPFALFPWFFVAPGLLATGLAAHGLRAMRRDPGVPGGADAAGHRPGTRPARIGLAVLGVGLIAAPAVFGMFERAPAGEAMLDDFREVMTQQTVSSAQQAFLLLAGAEGALRTETLPVLRGADVDTAQELPAITDFVDQWQVMAADMSPMVGAMSDNLERYEGLLALPPFGWFPWFFVGGGLALLASALAAPARVRTRAAANHPPEPQESPDDADPADHISAEASGAAGDRDDPGHGVR